MPKRKRKRTRLKAMPFLVIGLLIALTAGIMASPLTSLSKAYVKDANPEDKQEIDRILANLNGIPYVRVNPRWVETQVQRIQSVDKAEYSQNILGRGHLKVTYRSMVARVRSVAPMAMDRQGVIFCVAEVDSSLPMIAFPNPPPTTLTIAGAYPAGRIAQLAVKAKEMEPKEVLRIWFNRDGALCLNIGKGLVILGSTDDFETKLRVLQEFRRANPGQLARIEKLDLTAPSAPVTTSKKEL